MDPLSVKALLVLALATVALAQTPSPSPSPTPLPDFRDSAYASFTIWGLGFFLGIFIAFGSSIIFGVCEKFCGFLKTFATFAGSFLGLIFFVTWGTLYQTGYLILG